MSEEITATGSSKANLKSREARCPLGDRYLFDGYPLYPCPARTAVAPLQKPIDLLRLSLGLDIDTAVGGIAYKPVYPQQSCLLSRRISEEYTLDPSFDADFQPLIDGHSNLSGLDSELLGSG